MKWTIGETATQSGCSASTIRYYERIGLLPTPKRGNNGYRYYDADALEQLSFVHRARTLGFSIEAVADLLRLADHPNTPCDGVDRLLAEQIAAVSSKIEQLVELNSKLMVLQAACDGGHAVRDCGILATLSDVR